MKKLCVILVAMLLAGTAHASSVSVTEYAGDSSHGNPEVSPVMAVQAPQDFSAGPVAVNPQNANTRALMLMCDSPCTVLYGATIEAAVPNFTNPIRAGVKLIVDVNSPLATIWVRSYP